MTGIPKREASRKNPFRLESKVNSVAATTLDAVNGHIPGDREMVFRTGLLSMGDISERISNIDRDVVDHQRLVLLVSDLHQAFSIGDGGDEAASSVDE